MFVLFNVATAKAFQEWLGAARGRKEQSHLTVALGHSNSKNNKPVVLNGFNVKTHHEHLFSKAFVFLGTTVPQFENLGRGGGREWEKDR